MTKSQDETINKFIILLDKLNTHEIFVDDETNHSKVGQLKRRLQDVEQLKSEMENISLHYGANSIIITSEDENESDERVEYKFRDVLNQIFEVLGVYDDLVTKASSQLSSSSSTTSHSNQNLNVKLPTIELPKFNGDYTEWASFFDTFSSLVGSNESLSNSQKLHYLKSCLEDEPKKTLESLKADNTNYAIAVKLLKDRYENKRFIINNHLKNIFSLPFVNKSDCKSLRDFLDTLSINLNTLKALDRPVDQWSDLIIYIVVSKLDHFSSSTWEESLEPNNIPSHTDLISFLERRCKTLESISIHKINKETKSLPPQKCNINTPLRKRVFHTSYYKAQSNKKLASCFICEKNHNIFNCADFLKLTPQERLQHIKSLNRCSNCFRQNHFTKDCTIFGCKQCNKKHHTLLHIDVKASSNAITDQLVNDITDPGEGTSHCNLAVSNNILLSTAVILVKGPTGKIKECRALLDIGSQSHFITENLCKQLNLKIQNSNVSILGINSQSRLTKSAEVEIRSRSTDFMYNIKCLVIPKITENLPSYTFDINTIHLPNNLDLADPTFNVSSPVDILIGAELFLNLLTSGNIKLGKNQPVLQNSVLGWIISGKIPNFNNKPLHCYKISLESAVTRFWEIENVEPEVIVPSINKHSSKDLCEAHFYDTTSRSKDGRFVVRLPFVGQIPKLGNSRDVAMKRLLSLERKLSRDHKLRAGYLAFMREYLELGHMEPVPADVSKHSYYLPHSGVINENSSSTRLRVVFDGSAKSSNNLSLNDNLLAGPVLQPDLLTIIIQFRLPQFVITADISKMYRCIWVHPDDRVFQQILWRESPDLPVNTYQLKTITYGLTSSSYQAIKCVQQLGADLKDNYPLAHDVIMKCFYVDDILFGANTIPELARIKDELKTVLGKGGFSLSKWSSNCADVLKDELTSNECIITDKQLEKKTLGIRWDNESDNLSYTHFNFVNVKPTKRTILSAIAQLFDPLGLVNPVITMAKIIMQRLWSLKINWDDEIPDNLKKAWTSFLRGLPYLNKLQFPRTVICRDAIKIEIHGFCDSSEQAYGAAIFVRSIDSQLNIHVNLLCAKSRVAPLKTISLPRLELCGALLLAQLLVKVTKTINILPEQCFCWTDSQIVLSWLAADPGNWKTFVANRVSEIQQLTNNCHWNHVKSSENPADIITRGASPRELSTNTLWFNGPAWLHKMEIPIVNASNVDKCDSSGEGLLLEKRFVSTAVHLQTNSFKNVIFDLYSTFGKLKVAIACWLRVMKNLRNRVKKQPEIRGSLTTQELKHSEITIIRLVQKEAFSSEIHQLTHSKKLGNSSILQLNPFLDSNDLLRVGGRLSNVKTLPIDKKFPILLPKHYITELIIQDIHQSLLHAGQLGTLAQMRLKYWPISGRRQVRKVIGKCLKCYRTNPKPYSQIMGNLPEERIMPSRPFSKVGVDFGGPLLIKEGRGKGKRTTKSYICLFICLSTKAVHLELVGDLTSDSFLSALKRLISRRGNISFVLSDNATNFVGARKELQQLFKSEIFKNKLANENIMWKFIPPRAPNFGGIWEAGIKSVKNHIKRVIGENHLTYEEMYTLLVRIEAVLNSRPLTPLSNDPNDLSALTPGHFLIGHPLTAPVEKDHTAISSNRLSRWQLIEACRQHFWRRWSKEYLTTMQSRAKWQHTSAKVPEVGTLVVLKDDNLPPLQWPLGRITQLHPGNDGLVRVVSVRHKGGVVKRAITKVCALPID